MHHHNYILQAAHNVLHISYHVVHIIISYAMRHWNHGLDIRTCQNEGSTFGTLTRESSLVNTDSTSFIHRHLILFLSYTTAITSHTEDVV